MLGHSDINATAVYLRREDDDLQDVCITLAILAKDSLQPRLAPDKKSDESPPLMRSPTNNCGALISVTAFFLAF